MNEPSDYRTKSVKKKVLEATVLLLITAASMYFCVGPGRAAELEYDDSEDDYFTKDLKCSFEEDPAVDTSDLPTSMNVPPTPSELVLLSAAIEACPNGYDGGLEDLLLLIRLERELGVDTWGRGALLGVFCVEASYRSRTQKGGLVYGDYRNGVPMAHGPFQLWPVNRRFCGDSGKDSHDLDWAGRCWVRLVTRAHAKAEKKCPSSPWRTAEAAVSNIAKYRWSCHLSSKHWKVAEKINELYQKRIGSEI